MKLTVTNVLASTKRYHEIACRAARELCDALIRCGEGCVVLKSIVPHGQFEETLQGIGIAPRTARRYIQVAECKARDPKKFAHLLDNGASLVEVLREFGLVKPLPQAGYDAEKYEQRKALAQLEMAFSYDESLSAVRSIHKAKLGELSERSLKVLLRDTEEARDHLEKEISSRNGRIHDIETETNPEDKQP